MTVDTLGGVFLAGLVAYIVGWWRGYSLGWDEAHQCPHVEERPGGRWTRTEQWHCRYPKGHDGKHRMRRRF